MESTLKTFSKALALNGTLLACFTTNTFPVSKLGITKRNTCQKGKFQGITPNNTPNGRKVM